VPCGPPCCANDAVVTVSSATTKTNFFDILRGGKQVETEAPPKLQLLVTGESRRFRGDRHVTGFRCDGRRKYEACPIQISSHT
jgi:hypothetical protein